ncbi:MAG: hypothetical protein M3O46_14725 [Myxococcota bacterium]|nr:hypothetical protein [Myxococcota bacterium]
MGIDHIGKKGPPAPPPPATIGTGRVAASERPFEVAPPSANSPAAAQAAATQAPHTALEHWVRTGKLDVGGYLDLKVNEATAHLAALPIPELEAIRSALRDRMASDPTLVELVRRATGRLPDPGGDE